MVRGATVTTLVGGAVTVGVTTTFGAGAGGAAVGTGTVVVTGATTTVGPAVPVSTGGATAPDPETGESADGAGGAAARGCGETVADGGAVTSGAGGPVGAWCRRRVCIERRRPASRSDPWCFDELAAAVASSVSGVAPTPGCRTTNWCRPLAAICSNPKLRAVKKHTAATVIMIRLALLWRYARPGPCSGRRLRRPIIPEGGEGRPPHRR
jgi:hypothetical protein